jgi:hypothetical protein
MRAHSILGVVTFAGCGTVGGPAPKLMCGDGGYEVADGLGTSDDPGVGFTMDAALAALDTIRTVDAVPAVEMGAATSTVDADVQVVFRSDVRHMRYDGCTYDRGLEADVTVQVQLSTWLYGEVDTTLTALDDDLNSIWFGNTVEGQPFATLDLDAAAESEILAYDPIGCAVPPTEVAAILNYRFTSELLYLETERCDRGWTDYRVYPHPAAP